LDRALAIAELRSDTGLERRTLARAAFVDAFHLRWQECLTKGLQAVELTRHAEDLRHRITAQRMVAWALTVQGEREQARFHAAAVLAGAEELRDRWSLASAAFHNELLSLYEGDWRAAREMAELGLAAQPWDPRHLGLRAVLEYEIGRFEEGATYIARLQEIARTVPPPGATGDHVFVAALVPLVGHIERGVDDWSAVLAVAEGVLSLPRLAPGLARVTEVGLALIAVERRDAQAAEGLYAAIEPHKGTAVWLVPFAVDRLLGLLAATCGRIDVAERHFEDGLSFCDRAGYRAQYAWTACEYAEALLARAGPGDRDKAVALQDEALVLARELEMRPLMERILARREILKA
jgi:hypothetical protein